MTVRRKDKKCKKRKNGKHYYALVMCDALTGILKCKRCNNKMKIGVAI